MKKLNSKNRIYGLDIPVIGLTGGIATGKTTVSNYIRKLGHPLICADELIKNIYQKPETSKFINDYYPQVINSGQIDFKKLRKLFFSNPDIQKRIENFLYPLLPEEFRKAQNILPKQNYIFYDVPLLFEKNLDSMVDLILCVYAPSEIQIKRLMNRDHVSDSEARQILNKQLSIEEKKQRSDIVIDNSNSLIDLNSLLDKTLLKIPYI